MNLYSRDFTIPSEKEKKAFEEYEKWDKERKKNIFSPAADPRHSHPDNDVREFLWHYDSLFPNNHLLMPVYNRIDYSAEADAFEKIIYNAKNEQEIQRYIKNNRKWHIPGSIFLDYNFGHHAAYLFPEQSLGGEYVADYLLIGFNSDGCNLVFVEFEKANTEFILSTSNMESESVRKGQTQIRDWRNWMDDHRSNFVKDLGLLSKGIDVPTTRIFYYLVVSRRDFMSEEAKTIRSNLVSNDAHLKIVTFDRLVDNLKKLDNRITW